MTKYYQVPKKYDQCFIPASGYTLIGNEVITKKEAIQRKIKIAVLKPLPDVKTQDTYMFFGVRQLYK